MLLAHLVDALWTLIALVGVGVSIWGLVDATVDRRRRERAGSDGYEKLIILMTLRSAHASLYLHGFFLVLGVFGWLNASPAELSPTYVSLASGYIFVAFMNVRSVGLNQLGRLRARQGRLPA